MSANNNVKVGNGFTVAPNYIHEQRPKLGVYKAIQHGIWVTGEGLEILLRERKDHSWEVWDYKAGQCRVVKANLIDIPIEK